MIIALFTPSFLRLSWVLFSFLPMTLPTAALNHLATNSILRIDINSYSYPALSIRRTPKTKQVDSRCPPMLLGISPSEYVLFGLAGGMYYVAEETSRRLDAFLRAAFSFTFQPFDTRVDRSKRGTLHLVVDHWKEVCSTA